MVTLEEIRAALASQPSPECLKLTPFELVDADAEATVELKCSFLRPARLGVCTGEGRVLRAGRSIVFVEGKLWGSDGELAVHATATVAGVAR
jgi:acyl-coenzyme A thioesterase PaaI-like protein